MAVVTSTTLNTVSWTFTGFAVLLTVGRLWIRLKIIRKYGWDDTAHLIALLLLLAQVSIITGGAPLMYQVNEFATHQNQSEPNLALLMRLNTAVLLITWSCLYAVKIAFLLLYRVIFHVSTTFVRAWWMVFAFVLLSYGVIFVSSLANCGSPSAAPEKCNDPTVLSFKKKLVIYSYVLNVVSDLATMALPMGMLRKLQVPTVAKLGLAAIFSCALFIIAFDTIRVVETLTQDSTIAATPLWTNLESAISVIVSCLPSYAALLRQRQHSEGKSNIRHYERSLAMYENIG